MAFSTLRLHHRIVIPMVLVAILTTAIAAFVSQSLIRRTLEGRVVAQLAAAARAVSRSDFALNRTILDRVKEITGADVVTYTAAGEVLASTTSGPPLAQLMAAITSDSSIAAAGDDETIVRELACSGVPCYVAYRRVTTRSDAFLALVEEASELRAATRTMTRMLLLSAGIGLIVLVLVGQLTARRVTRPLDRLVSFTRDVASSPRNQRAPVGEDEIGTLANAFNDMLDRLEQAQQALVRSEKLAVTGLLAARVAHDIRNPLSSLKMQAQLLRTRVPAGEGQSMIQGILHDVDQVESVVRGLLELARPGDVAPEPTQLNDIVRQVLGHLTSQLSHSKVVLSSDLDGTLPAVPLDASRFKQAFLNVLANAIEAMPGGGRLDVATRTADDGTAVLLTVCDDGVGVDPTIADRIFDPFVSTKREGVGLGLVNTRSIIESHGGSVRLTPRTGRGTCVRISLPRSRQITNAGSPTHA